MDEIKINYFVSYRFSNGFGRCLITYGGLISSIDDLVAIEKEILRDRQDKGLFTEGPIIVVGWQKFELPQ